MATIVFIIIAYLIGSVSFAVLLSRLYRLPDPRTYGSKNPGATNVLRTGKKTVAALTLLGDAAKGWFAVYLAQHFASRYGLGSITIAAVALAVFLGHSYSVFLRFQGGKGVSTTCGVLLALNLWLGLTTLATWLVIVFVSRISSLAALDGDSKPFNTAHKSQLGDADLDPGRAEFIHNDLCEVFCQPLKQ